MNSTPDQRKAANKWMVLAAFFGVVAISHALWLSLAPLASSLQQSYGVGEEAVSLFLLVFPLLYIVLSLHAGTLIDRRGYRFSVLLGSFLTSAFSILRIADDSFILLLVGQVGVAIGQPYLVNAISKLVADQFKEGQQAMATGIGIAGMLVGMAVGLGLTPVLHERLGFSMTMVVFSVASTVLSFAFWSATVSDARPKASPSASGKIHLASVLRERALTKLCVTWFFAYGAFNGLTTWLEPILKPHGVNPEQAGFTGAAIIVGGIVGCFVLPSIADRWNWQKPLAILSCSVAVALVWPLCTASDMSTLLGLGFALGFFFLPGYPIVLAMSEQAVGSTRSGAAVGLIMLVGNAGAVAVIVLMPLSNAPESGWQNSVFLLLALLGLALAGAINLSSCALRAQQLGSAQAAL